MRRTSKNSGTDPEKRAARLGAGRVAAVAALAAMLGGCASFGASGPSSSAIVRAGKAGPENSVALVEIDGSAIDRLNLARQRRTFAEVLGDSAVDPTVIGAGDSIDITVWEAPPALLFGTSNPLGPSASQSINLPQQMVGSDGRVTIPFVGPVLVAGKSTRQAERDIVASLQGKANAPQALVRLSQNEARTVTILGEVAASRRLPLTSRGERLLDAIAAAGGPRQAVGKSTIQLTRSATTVTMPLDELMKNPAQNIRLRPGDLVAVLYQPFSFTALGASNVNAQIPFEATGMSLAEALGRIGGLRDERANVKGVFIFRYESPDVLGALAQDRPRRSDGRVPTVYRFDLSNPSSLLLSQEFQIEDKDVIYVSNAPLSDLQKFLGIVSSATFSIVGISNAVQ